MSSEGPPSSSRRPSVSSVSVPFLQREVSTGLERKSYFSVSNHGRERERRPTFKLHVEEVPVHLVGVPSLLSHHLTSAAHWSEPVSVHPVCGRVIDKPTGRDRKDRRWYTPRSGSSATANTRAFWISTLLLIGTRDLMVRNPPTCTEREKEKAEVRT